MGATLDTNKLKGIRVTGRGLTADVIEVASKVTLSSGTDTVTELGLTFNDSMDLSTFRTGMLTQGSSIIYGQWAMVVEDIDVKPGPIGPQLEVKAPSRTVSSLRNQTGGKSWGTVSADGWVLGQLRAIGARHLIQPNLGSALIIREPPDEEGNAESTWDVMVALAREKGVWLFERGRTMVFAKPSWLIQQTQVRRTWNFTWKAWNDYSESLAGMPSYSNHMSGNPRETCAVRVISADADSVLPGDQVVLSGNVGPMGGSWIVVGVDYPFTVGAAVTFALERPINPKAQPPRAPAAAASRSTAKPAARVGRTATVSVKSPTVVAGLSAAVDRFYNAVNGRYLDYDGAFGAQCVDLLLFYNRDVVGGGAINGNGNQWFYHPNNLGSYTRYPVGGANGEPGFKGDIACWGSFYGGGFGHVAIVLQDRGNSLLVLSQNPGPVRAMVLSKQGLQGYLRPRRHR